MMEAVIGGYRCGGDDDEGGDEGDGGDDDEGGDMRCVQYIKLLLRHQMLFRKFA